MMSASLKAETMAMTDTGERHRMAQATPAVGTPGPVNKLEIFVGRRSFGEPTRTMRPPSISSARSQNVTDDSRIVAHHHDRVTQSVKLAEALLAPGLESGVANRENLIEHQNLADGSKGDRVGKACRHAARVVLQLEIGKPLELGESQDLGETRGESRRATSP